MVVHTGTADWSVAELQITGDGVATLHVFSSATNLWSEGLVVHPLGDRAWRGSGALADGETLIWVDLSAGFLSCDIANPMPESLNFLSLPPGRERPAGTPDLDKSRCASVCYSGLRFMDIQDGAREEGEPQLTLWSLVEGVWSLDFTFPFKALWSDPGYVASKLPPETPTVGFIHPSADFAYFLLGKFMFGVDCARARFLGFEYFHMVHPPRVMHSSRYVIPWLIPSNIAGDDEPDG